MSRQHIACQRDGHAARLIRNKCRGRVTRRPYVRLRPLAYITRSRPRGSIGSPPWWGAVAYVGQVRTRLGLDTCRYQTPAWVLFKARACSVLGPWDPPMGGPDPIRGGPACTREGPGPTLGVRTVYPAVRRSPMGSGPTIDALEYATFSEHVVASDLPMWWSRALLWAQNSRLRLGRAVAWSHTQHFYHTVAGGTLVSGYRQFGSRVK
jgi:hypothetical protein